MGVSPVVEFLVLVLQNANEEEVTNNVVETDSDGEEIVYRSKKTVPPPRADKAPSGVDDSRVNDQRHVVPAYKSTLVL